MYSLNYQVTTSTCDSEGRLKLYSALQMMQDCSELWLDSEPAALDFFVRHHMTQLLASRQVEVVRVPNFKEHLTVTTSVYGLKPMFGFRNTFIYDAQGRVCYKSWGMGAFVDLDTGKLHAIDDDVLATVFIDKQLEMNCLGRRITLPKAPGTPMPPIRVLRADIDYNRHLNNANYIRMAMELLPADFEVNGLRVEYKVPAKEGELLEPEVYDSDGHIFVSLSTHDALNAIIEFC
ncbi:MAG: thioesterase [Prevotella sp.]|nr:thioesterase [Prevotella sp.]